jgi:hypothetical protein
MVFCKLTKKLKSRLESAEESIQTSTTNTKNLINKHIEDNLNTIENTKSSISAKIQQKLEEKKRVINETIIKPHQEKVNNNRAMMYFVDVSLSIVLGIFLYKTYPFLKSFFAGPNYTKDQLENAMKLPETSYSKEDLRKVQEFRDSFQNWIDYYKTEDAFSEINLGVNEIRRGNDLREPLKFMIQYFIPYVILAYVVWFIIKYIKYVIAAIWGFFVTVYQFVTKKITCKLAEKWYIRLATGWSKCHPQFDEYVDQWKNTYITRPIAEERISYLRGVQNVKTQYQAKYGQTSPWNVGLNWGFGWFWELWDWLMNLKRIYIDLPIEELYLQLIRFHPTYVVHPYEILGSSLSTSSKKYVGDVYPSKTKKGKICKCPPRKTVYKQLKSYLKTTPQKARDISSSAKSTAININKGIKKANINLEKATNSAIRSAKSSRATKTVSDWISSASSCTNVDTAIDHRKTVAQGIWTTLMIITTGVIVYSLLSGGSTIIDNLFNPVYKFTNGYIPKATLSNTSISILMFYFSVFFSLGYYSFIA